MDILLFEDEDEWIEEFLADQRKYDNVEDDGIRPLDEEEFWKRFHRVNGDVICEQCGLPYRKHPNETRFLDRDGNSMVKRLCNGWFGKL